MSDDRCQSDLRYDTKNGRVVLVMVISQLRACLYIDEVNLLARLAGLARLMLPLLLRVFVVSYVSYLDFFYYEHSTQILKVFQVFQESLIIILKLM